MAYFFCLFPLSFAAKLGCFHILGNVLGLDCNGRSGWEGGVGGGGGGGCGEKYHQKQMTFSA